MLSTYNNQRSLFQWALKQASFFSVSEVVFIHFPYISANG